MGRQIRALIIAPHDLSRNGLIALISRPASKVRVVGAFPELEDGHLELVRLNPHVLLLDDVLPPTTDVIEILHQLRNEFSRLHIIMISSRLNVRYMQTLLAAGASGYVYKEDHLEESLIWGIDIVYHGHTYLSPRASSLETTNNNFDSTVTLNRSDMRVLHLIDRGLTPKDISIALGLTIRSVYRIRNKLRAVVGAPTHEHLVAAAQERGLLDGQLHFAPSDGQYVSGEKLVLSVDGQKSKRSSSRPEP